MHSPLQYFALLWDWEFDRDFVDLLAREMEPQPIRFLPVHPGLLGRTLDAFQSGELRCAVFLDRASDTDERFLPLARALRRAGVPEFNPPPAIHQAADKATMHLEFLAAGIDVPYTIIVSPYAARREVELSLSELARLGRPFIIKPANTTGGGVGVVLGAETLKDVIETRQHHKNDKYLLQEEIRPVLLPDEEAWFRVFYVSGMVLTCWWNPVTHVYRLVHGSEMKDRQVSSLVGITRRIAGVCGLDFFSTEIAVTQNGRVVVVDYVNETCDMRLQSHHQDGVPDRVARSIARRLALMAGRKRGI